MSEEQKISAIANEVLVQLLDDLLNNRNFKVVDDTFSNECINRTPIVETVGKEAFKNKFLLPLFTAFPDLNWISHEVIVDLPTIINRWTFSGTHKGEYAGYPACNKKVTWSGVSLNRLNETGKIIEVNTFYDRKDLFDQFKS